MATIYGERIVKIKGNDKLCSTQMQGPAGTREEARKRHGVICIALRVATSIEVFVAEITAAAWIE